MRPRKGARLVGDALFEASVAAQDVGIVVDDGEPVAVEGGGEVRLRDRHADCVGDALPEGAGRRLDAGRVPVFGVPGRLVAELAEVHQVFFGDVVAEEVEQGIIEHGAVSRGEHEPVPVLPLGVFGVEFEEVCKDGVPDGRAAEGQARVSRICLLNGLRGKHADGVYRLFTNVHKRSVLLVIFFYLPTAAPKLRRGVMSMVSS